MHPSRTAAPRPNARRPKDPRPRVPRPKTTATSRHSAIFFLILTATLLLLSPTLAAQSLQLSVQSPTGDNAPSTFALDGGEITFGPSSVSFLNSGPTVENVDAWGVSADLSVVGILKRAPGTDTGGGAGRGSATAGGGSRVLVMNAGGDTLLSYPAGDIAAGDGSAALFPAGSGSVWIRENVSSFTRYDVFGRPALTLSGGVQGSGGATMPRVISDPAGKTMVIYNSQVKNGGGDLGSGAQLVTGNGELQNIYYSENRSISYADISSDGQFIVLVTEREGTDDRVRIMDRYGNSIATVSTEEELARANLDGSAEYLVGWSEGRAIVWSTLSGERVRSASFRDPLFHAQYFPGDQTIIGLTGEYHEETGLMNGVGFYAIHLGKGQIASAKLGSALGFAGTFRPSFRRTAEGRYLLLGSSKRVEIRAEF